MTAIVLDKNIMNESLYSNNINNCKLQKKEWNVSKLSVSFHYSKYFRISENDLTLTKIEFTTAWMNGKWTKHLLSNFAKKVKNETIVLIIYDFS